jgi:hypothetical protein
MKECVINPKNKALNWKKNEWKKSKLQKKNWISLK